MRTAQRLAAGLGVLTLGLTGAMASTTAVAAPHHYRTPVAQPLPDPGVLHIGGNWVVYATTGNWNSMSVGVASNPAGPYQVTKRPLLKSRPAWMSATDKSVWAPSIIESRFKPGHFDVYYAGVVKGTNGRRCIGSASGASSVGPFTPNDRPIACWNGSGTRSFDTIPNEGHGISLIDPTPAQDAAGHVVLTYKTQYKAPGSNIWHTTTRLLAVSDKKAGRIVPNPVHASGGSVKISDSRSKYIEENPVLVDHGSRWTLFTSFGWFGTCHYSTRYRQSANLWTGWKNNPRTLSFGKKTKTCGTGNAQVIAGATPDSWLVFFNGHLDFKSNPKAQRSPRGPQGLYVGNVTWKHGRPTVSSLL